MTNWEKNTMVWAKYGNFPHWPAIIDKINQKTNECNVLFFGEDLKGIVKLKDLRKWEITLTKETKKNLLSDKDMAFAYGIALKYIQNEFEFKQHVKFIKLVDKKKVVKEVQSLLILKKISKTLHSVEKKNTTKEIKASNKKEKRTSKTSMKSKLTSHISAKETNKQIDNSIKIAHNKTLEDKENKNTFLNRKRNRDDIIQNETLNSQTTNPIRNGKKIKKIKNPKVEESSIEIKDNTSNEYITDTSNKETKGLLQSLVPNMKNMEASKNIIYSTLKNIISIISKEEEEVEVSTIKMVNDSFKKIQRKFSQLYEKNYTKFIESQQALFADINSQINSIEENTKMIDADEQNQHLTPDNCLALISKMKSILIPHILSPEIAKFVSLYHVFQTINKEFNDDNLAHVLSSIQLFHSQVIKGSFLFRSLSNTPDDFQNPLFRSKIRETIKNILNKVFDYLSIPITESLENNIVNYLEISTAKKDPTISIKYNDIIKKLLNIFKEELLMKSTLISTILV